MAQFPTLRTKNFTRAKVVVMVCLYCGYICFACSSFAHCGNQHQYHSIPYTLALQFWGNIGKHWANLLMRQDETGFCHYCCIHSWFFPSKIKQDKSISSSSALGPLGIASRHFFARTSIQDIIALALEQARQFKLQNHWPGWDLHRLDSPLISNVIRRTDVLSKLLLSLPERWLPSNYHVTPVKSIPCYGLFLHKSCSVLHKIHVMMCEAANLTCCEFNVRYRSDRPFP